MSAFVLSREYELQLPISYVDIDRAEMEYVDGGYSIPVNVAMLSSAYCLSYATTLWIQGVISFSNILVIAKEIRGHAAAYYGLSGLSALGISNSTLEEMKRSANPIDIRDGYDPRWYVVAACELIWTLPG
ncbi:hypothetical protein [Clostridium isatidis]|uniref:Uncharacterized protein n=1 Tax=Clostridium isatidis TaxID=182773 RepID=A0A343J9L2_9CLOT|nr:hypothetical protein [Clostridium isatidis]ASW42220.1 hypothetical protein BEN51_01550 [Clostridium isatidis]